MQKSLFACLFAFLSLSTGAATAAAPVHSYEGRGVQVFRCTASGAGASWQLLGPDAHLYDADGKIVARHFFGPSWQADDGSKITGKVMIADASPDGASAAPWLVLRIVAAEGSGVFAPVEVVTRTDTHGGGAPGQACTTTNAGTTVRVPYSARYVFFSH